MNKKIKIFIGSSSEAVRYDYQVQQIIESFGADIVHWKDIFYPGDNTLDSLLKISSRVNGALLIITPDDKTWYRENEKISPRDNILFELGLFISALGKHNAVILFVIPKNKQAATLPTDLQGINFIPYYEIDPESNKSALKKWFSRIELEHSKFQSEINGLASKFTTIISPIPNENKEFVFKYLNTILGTIKMGEIKLDIPIYYNLLYKEMHNADEKLEVNAIALLPPEIWFQQIAQTEYIEKNMEAARNGATIRRLFIIRKNPPLKLSDIILQQLDAGIKIRYLRYGSFFIENTSELQDTVLFINNRSKVMRAYIAESELEDSPLITSSRLIFDQDICHKKKAFFDALWGMAKDLAKLKISLNLNALKELIGAFPDDLVFEFNKSDLEVVSCKAAAKIRKVPLKHELKTLILNTSLGIVALHIPGDKKASLRKVKKRLNCKEAYLASFTKLKELDTGPGTVSPFLPKIWNLKHLISRNIFNLEFLTTNSGTLTDYIKFSPYLLLYTRDKIIDDFEIDD